VNTTEERRGHHENSEDGERNELRMGKEGAESSPAQRRQGELHDEVDDRKQNNLELGRDSFPAN
jgi:hypothetical protein